MNPRIAATYRNVTRLLCPFCIAITGFIVYDIVMPAAQTDDAVVLGKTRQLSESGYAYAPSLSVFTLPGAARKDTRHVGT